MSLWEKQLRNDTSKKDCARKIAMTGSPVQFYDYVGPGQASALVLWQVALP